MCALLEDLEVPVRKVQQLKRSLILIEREQFLELFPLAVVGHACQRPQSRGTPKKAVTVSILRRSKVMTDIICFLSSSYEAESHLNQANHHLSATVSC